jgi:methylisocitrate lyase
MSDLKKRADDFRALHVRGRPLILFNIWDAGSAKAVASAGGRAIATGSWAVAAANGFGDGEQLPLDLAIDNLRRITGATDLPVTIDIERGYGATPADVGRTVARTIEAGAIGCNIEDSLPEGRELRQATEQASRVEAARREADASGVRYFINARTDVFFRGPADGHDDAMLAAALERARAYADAGADGLFAPGLVDLALISRLAAASPLPLNIMTGQRTPSVGALADAGVARVSHGAGPYATAMKMFGEIARAALAEGA